MLRNIPDSIFNLYKPVSRWESFYLRTRWRLCPFELIESCIPSKGRILDFGCGYGMLSNFLAERSSERSVVGIDMNPTRMEVASRSVFNRKNIHFHLGDVGSLEVSSFEAAAMTDVLHHIRDDQVEILLRKIHRCLGEDGLLAILDVDRKPFWKFCITYSIDSLLNPKDRLWYRPLGRLEEILKSSGFQTEKIIRADWGLPLADVLLLCRKSETNPVRDDKGLS